MVKHALQDGFDRKISYLRIAVTDKCNFRCVYCMPADGVPPRAHGELLSAEEIARFVRLVAGEGITRVRLTGGEPLVSHRIIPLIEEIRAIPQIKDISLTTNGVLLPRLAPKLKEAGLDRVNISLDTLDPVQFSKVTRLGRLEQTLAGIDAALEYGFDPVKVNCVVVRRLNQDVLGMANLSVDRPVHVRFIEYMPIGSDEIAGFAQRMLGKTRMASFVPSNGTPAIPCLQRATPDYRRRCQRCGGRWLEPVDNALCRRVGPARYWRFPGAAGTVGFISAMSNHFCSSCNRMRLTADGAIRHVCFPMRSIAYERALRSGDDARVVEIFRDAVAHKPQEHEVIEGTERFMSQIGG